jgi:hypothetical protein
MECLISGQMAKREDEQIPAYDWQDASLRARGSWKLFGIAARTE